MYCLSSVSGLEWTLAAVLGMVILGQACLAMSRLHPPHLNTSDMPLSPPSVGL
jgi:hypothetical protein